MRSSKNSCPDTGRAMQKVADLEVLFSTENNLNVVERVRPTSLYVNCWSGLFEQSRSPTIRGAVASIRLTDRFYVPKRSR